MEEADVIAASLPPEGGEQASERAEAELQVWQHPTALTVWKNLFSPLVVLVAIAWAVLQNAASDDELVRVWGWLLGLGVLAVLVVTAGVLVVGLVSTAWAYAVWRHTRFAFLKDGIHVASGIFVKRREQVRWERIQSVEITQDFVAQVFRQGTLTISNLGSDPSMKIGLLPNSELEVLRLEILAFAARARAGEAITERDCEALLVRRARVRAGGTDAAHVSDVDAAHVSSTDSHADVPQGAQQLPSPAQGVTESTPGHRSLFTQSLGQSCVAAFLDAAAIAPAIAAVFVFIVFDSGEGFGAFVAIAFVAGAIVGVAKRANAVWNLRVDAVGGGLRVRVGGAGTSARMILPGRITTVRISQPFLYRPLNLWRLDVYTLAGLSEVVESANSNKTDHVIPAGTYEQVREVALYILEAMDLSRDGTQGEREDGSENVDSEVRAGEQALRLNPQMYDVIVRGDCAWHRHAEGSNAKGDGSEAAMPVASTLGESGLELGCFYRASRRARWFSPFAYKREGVALFPECIATRGGWLRRRASVARLERLQSVKVHAGPFDRALGVASVTAVFTIADSNVRFDHGDQAVAEAVALEVAVLATKLQREEHAQH